MRFYANSVSASAEGNYYVLWFDVTDSDVEETNPRKPTGPYLFQVLFFPAADKTRASRAPIQTAG